MGHPKEALKDLNQAVDLDLDFQPARLNRGVAKWLAGNLDGAIAEFDACLTAPADKRLVEAAFYRGQLSMKAGRDREALADFSLVIDERPSFRPTYWLRAQTQFRRGNYNDGQADLNRFVALAHHDESRARTQMLLGAALQLLAMDLKGAAKTEALKLAADELQAAISSGVQTSETFRHLGAVRELQGKAQGAITAYSQGLKLSSDKDKVPLLNLRGWAHVGEGQKQYSLARDDFTEALCLEPNNPESHAGLGFVLAEVESADDARTEASASLLCGSDNYLVLHNVACVYGRLSESDPRRKLEHENLALAALKRAVELSRRHPTGPDEISLIRRESAFPTSLQSRPEFKQLLAGQSTNDR
jgi:tetratricopeptide (TPR) repeat protein